VPAAAAGARPADDGVRSGTTLVALEQLAAGGYVGREDARHLAEAYRWLRTVEHRLQLHRLRRTHLLPAADDEEGLRRSPAPSATARTCCRSSDASAPGYTPRGAAAAREALLPPAARRRRPPACRPGPAHPRGGQGAAWRPSASRSRPSRCATWRRSPAGCRAGRSSSRRCLPAMLGVVRRRRRPRRGAQVVPVGLGRPRRHALVPAAAARRGAGGRAAGAPAGLLPLRRRPARPGARGRPPARLRPRAPAPAARGRWSAPSCRSPGRREDWEGTVAAARGMRTRGAAARRLRRRARACSSLDQVGAALSDVALRSSPAALETATPQGRPPSGAAAAGDVAVLAMGRLGGREQGYGSDADVLFVHEALPGVARGRCRVGLRHDVAHEVRRLLGPAGARPAAGRRRRPAAGGQAGAAEPQPRRRTPPTTRAGPSIWEAAGARCGAARSSATPGWPPASWTRWRRCAGPRAG
jgi:glutamate-ammonia-ligase adenylyltransferase